MSAEVTIACDECGRVIDAAKTAAKARERVREAGGKTLARGRDICGWCVAEAAEAQGGQDGAA